MKLFAKLLVAPAALGLLAPISVSATEFGRRECGQSNEPSAAVDSRGCGRSRFLGSSATTHCTYH